MNLAERRVGHLVTSFRTTTAEVERGDRGLAIGVKREGWGRSATDVTRRVGGRKHGREWVAGRWWNRIGSTGVYGKGGGGGCGRGGRDCLTGIGIDRPRDAMERIAEGCWSMLRDVKSTPPTLPLLRPDIFSSPAWTASVLRELSIVIGEAEC